MDFSDNEIANSETIFDPIRGEYLVATPEERVRQQFVRLLIDSYGYPSVLMANEFTIRLGKLSRRCDTVVFDKSLRPLVIVEYKAPHIPLNQKVVEQVFRYNSVLQVPYIFITNGRQMAIYRVGYGGCRTESLPEIPQYSQLQNPI